MAYPPNRGTAGSNPLYQTNKFSDMLTSMVHQSAYDKTRIQRMYEYPANRKEALMHRKANEFGYNSKTVGNDQATPLCPCCELPINTVRIKLKYGTTPSKKYVKAGGNIFLLNSGSAMFFTFIKMTIVYLLLRFVLSDCYNLISNTTANTCSSPQYKGVCENNAMAKFSTYNKDSEKDEAMLYVVDILNLITVVLSIAFFMYYRKFQYEVYSLTDLSNHTQSEYTIFVEDIPIFLPSSTKSLIRNTASSLEFDYQNELKTLFEGEIKDWIATVKADQGKSNRLSQDFYKLLQSNPQIEKGPKVVSVSLCFDLTEMEKLNEMRGEMMRKHNQNVEKQKKQDEASINHIPTQIACINEEYINLSKKFSMDNSSSFNLSHFVGKAFVSFEYEHYQDYFLSYLKHENKLKFNDEVLKLSSAAQPSDIYWFNMKIPANVRRASIIYSFLIMFLALAFSFCLLFGIQFYQSAHYSPPKPGQEPQSNALNYLFTITMTVLTTVINFLLAAVIEKLTDWERHKTKTDYIVSLMIKTIIAQFLNTAVIYYIISVTAALLLPDSENSPLDENGLVMEVTSLVAVSGIIQIVMNALQPGTLFGSLMNWYRYRGKETVNMFQVQFNQELQDPEFNFSAKYAYYIINVYIVCFYSYITPYVGIILAIIFVIQYWVDKYNLFQRFSCPIDFNFKLSRLTLKAFECSIFVFALGNFLFSFTIHATEIETEYHVINLVSLCLALVYCISIMFMPRSWFETVEAEGYEKISYSECLKKEYFNRVYWLTNPATSFAKEADLNNRGKFVNYGESEAFADAKDFDKIVEAEKRGEYNVQTYSPEDAKMIADVMIDIQASLVGDMIKQDDDDVDVFSKLEAAAGAVKQ